MTNEEIRMMYREALDKKKQIKILADMTLKTKAEIEAVVADLIPVPGGPSRRHGKEEDNPPAMNPRQARVGKNGTVTIPKVVRVSAGIFAGTVVDVTLSGEAVVMRPRGMRCHICGGGAEVMVFTQGVGICRPCAKKALERMDTHYGCKG